MTTRRTMVALTVAAAVGAACALSAISTARSSYKSGQKDSNLERALAYQEAKKRLATL